MKLWMPFQIQSLKTWEDLRRFTDQGFKNLFTVLNGGIGFQDNVCCDVQEVTLSTSTSTISHNLGKVPYGFLVLNQNANAVIYSSNFDWTDSNIYLTASASVTAKIAILGG